MTPEAQCPACGFYSFVDNLDVVPTGVIRTHSSQDPAVRRRAIMPKPGKPYGVTIPNCRGSGQAPRGPLRWPDGQPYVPGEPYVLATS